MARGVTSILMKSLQKWTVTVSCVSLKCYADSLRKKQVKGRDLSSWMSTHRHCMPTMSEFMIACRHWGDSSLVIEKLSKHFDRVPEVTLSCCWACVGMHGLIGCLHAGCAAGGD